MILNVVIVGAVIVAVLKLIEVIAGAVPGPGVTNIVVDGGDR